MRLDFRRSLVSGLLTSLRGRSAGSFPEQRLVIEPILEHAAILNLPAIALNNPRSFHTSKFLKQLLFVLIIINID